MAKPHKLTPDVQARIVEAIAQGATYEHAAAYGGVAYETFRRWMRAGEQARSGRLAEFVEAVRSAEAQAVVRWLRIIDEAAATTWQAAAWKLERRYPQYYGRPAPTVRLQTEQVAEPQPIILRWADDEEDYNYFTDEVSIPRRGNNGNHTR